MSSPDAEPAHRPEISNAESAEAVAEAPHRSGSGAVRLWLVTLAAGALAGAGSWWAAEHVYGRHPMERMATQGYASPEETRSRMASLRRGITVETSRTFAILGGAVALALGLAGGLARGAAPAALGAGAVGLPLAAGAGFLATHLMLPIYFGAYRADNDDLGLAVVLQGGVCAPIGAAAGVAFGLGLREGGRPLDFRLVAGGLLGAIAGVVVYQLAGAIAFPFDGTALPLSNSPATRLFDHESVAVLTALGVLASRSIGPRGM
jgi:hypothetical protein